MLFKLWKTVTLGLHKTLKEYEKNYRFPAQIDVTTRKVAHNIGFSQTEVQLDLCKTTIGELGFKEGARYEDICQHIVEVGGELCPAEVGIALLREHPDSFDPFRSLWVAMEAVPGHNEVKGVFCYRFEEHYLTLISFYRAPKLSPTCEIVFVLPRK